MTGSALTPDAALGWLRSLSIDIIAGAIVDANGTLLAGDAELARSGPAARPHEAGDAASASDAERVRSGAQSHLVSARSERHAIVVRVGPRALERLVRADLQAALEALESR
jgi:hypothetical protein